MAPAFQKSEPPGCFINNSQNTIRYGKEITDYIATWVAEGYAAGPFEGLLCPHFHGNPLLAVVQPGKVRPVLDVSSSKEDSFKSTVDDYEAETVKMASAKKFGQNLLNCGKNATMSKHYLLAAYAQVPCKIKDLRLQGFAWLGKFFVKTPGIWCKDKCVQL